jgi:chitinase
MAAQVQAQGMWVTAYYTGWRQGHLRPADIDFGAVTHLVHFAVVPRPDGTLDAAVNMLTPKSIAAVVSAAHAAGKKILFTVGGQNSRAQFEGAMSPPRRKAFIAALISFMREHGYDGIDVDMEELPDRDARAYAAFIRELRAGLDRFTPRPLLTAAALWQPSLFAELASQFDQINLMTYNLAGPYPGWVVWHSGSLYDGGRRFPNGRARLPSVDGLAETFLAAGVPRGKLGVGLSFNGYVWSGGAVSRPGQTWELPPAMKHAPYYVLAETYHIKEYDEDSPGYHWDAQAQAAYLSIQGESPSDAQFVSYVNTLTAEKLVQYVRSKGLGGLIVWDLAAGWRAGEPPGRRDLLLQAVKQARLGPPGAAR